jgi:hypothetical protein
VEIRAGTKTIVLQMTQEENEMNQVLYAVSAHA